MLPLVALVVALMLGDAGPSAVSPLDARIAAERARNASQPPVVVAAPERYAPRLRAVTRHVAGDDCPGCPQRLRRYPARVDDPEGYSQVLLALVAHFEAKRSRALAEVAAIDVEIAAARGRRAKVEQLQGRRARSLARADEDGEQVLKLLKALVSTPQLGKGPNVEEGLYLYVLELDLQGRDGERTAARQRFAREFPNSRYQSHLVHALAHRRLAHNQLTAARASFEELLAIPGSELHPDAHVAIGWSHLRSEAGEAPRPDLALAAFIRALEALPPGGVADPRRRSAQDGLVHAFAAAGRPGRAVALFTRLVPAGPVEDPAVELLERLGLAYFARGQHRDSARIYGELLRLRKDDPRACGWQMRVLLAAVAFHDHAAQLREALRLGDMWRRGAVELPPDVSQRCHDDAREALSDLADRWHTAAPSRTEKICAAVRRLFPDEPIAGCPTGR